MKASVSAAILAFCAALAVAAPVQPTTALRPRYYQSHRYSYGSGSHRGFQNGDYDDDNLQVANSDALSIGGDADAESVIEKRGYYKSQPSYYHGKGYKPTYKPTYHNGNYDNDNVQIANADATAIDGDADAEAIIEKRGYYKSQPSYYHGKGYKPTYHNGNYDNDNVQIANADATAIDGDADAEAIIEKRHYYNHGKGYKPTYHNGNYDNDNVQIANADATAIDGDADAEAIIE